MSDTICLEIEKIETINNEIKITNNEIDIVQRNKLIKECYTIYNIIKKYVMFHYPTFNNTFNEEDPINSIDTTYVLEIPYNVIQKITRVLKLLHYHNKTYLSNDEKNITGLPYKSYAYYKEIIYKNGNENIYKHYVFCLENDKKCKGILLSPDF
jgi:hypothetical protein